MMSDLFYEEDLQSHRALADAQERRCVFLNLCWLLGTFEAKKRAGRDPEIADQMIQAIDDALRLISPSDYAAFKNTNLADDRRDSAGAEVECASLGPGASNEG